MFNYQHKSIHGDAIDLPTGKAICVGQNYHDHIEEMGSVVNGEAVLFMKPNTAFCDLLKPIDIPLDKGECHNEVEITVLIKSALTCASQQDVMDAIWGYGLGLDLTLRDIQKSMKTLGRPWERSKSFDKSAPLSPFIPVDICNTIDHAAFSLQVNGEMRQKSNTELMIRNVPSLLSLISHEFTLLPGDVIFTGTPKGVAALHPGDELQLSLENYNFGTNVTKG
ncbi:fumarylacetoacetate hydrolase family protein [Thalassotalea euphylliae]|uniref:fumarylacetoacetate hydrolase family protein n=1 Tax=Thalassotalea euphylliae TaxID=1655234 RepID=UPI0036298D44